MSQPSIPTPSSAFSEGGRVLYPDGKADATWSASTSEATSSDAAPISNGNSTSPSTSAKGMSRLPFVRKIITKLIDSTAIRVTGLDVHKPQEGLGLKAHIKLRIRDVAKGPVPMSATVKFQGVTELCWPSTTASRDKKNPKRGFAGPVIASVALDPMRLQAIGPGLNIGEADIVVGNGTDAESRSVGQLVRAVIRASGSQGLPLVFRANGLTVKALGFTFKGLTIEKEVRIGGLEELGGALRLPEPSNRDGLDYLGLPPTTRQRSGSASSTSYSSDVPRKSALGFFKKKSFRRGEKGSETSSTTQDTVAPSNDDVASSAPIAVQNLEITGGDPQNGITVTAFVDVKLPTAQNRLPDFSVEIGRLKLSLYAVVESTGELVKCGFVESAETDVITSGPTRLNVAGYVKMPTRLPMDSPQRAAAANILSSFLQNEPVSIVALVEHPSPFDRGASEAAWLSYGIAGARLNGFLAPLGDRARLLDGAQLRAEDDASSKYSSSRDTPLEAKSPNKQQQLLSSSTSPQSGPAERLTIRTTIHNSFGAPVAATKLRVRAVDDADNAIELGTVETPPSWPGVRINAGESESIALPFQLNADPAAMVKLLRSNAARDNFEFGDAFTHLLALLNNETTLDQNPPRDSQGNNPETPDFPSVLSAALANLKVTAYVGLDELEIGGYRLPGGIDYIQRGLAVSIPATAASLLIPQVGAPLVYKLVEAGSIALQSIDVATLDDSGLTGSARVGLTGFGPLSAQIFIDGGLAMIWDSGDSKGQMAAILHILQPLQIESNTPTTCQCDIKISPLRRADGLKVFSRFVASLLMDGSTTWRLEAPQIRAIAGGVEFTTSLAKTVVIQGFGGFPDLATNSFDIVREECLPRLGHPGQQSLSPSTDEANALRFRASLTLPNSSNIGIYLARLDFDLLIDGVIVGFINIFDINLQAGSGVKVDGEGVLHRISDYALMGKVASALMNGEDIVLGVRGRSAFVTRTGGGAGRRPQPKRSLGSSSMMQPSSPTSPNAAGDLVRMAWLDSAIQQIHTTAKVRGEFETDVVERLELESLKATFPMHGQPKIAIGALFVKYQIPYPIDVAVESVAADVEILLDDVVVGKGTTSECIVMSADEQAGTRRRRSSSQTSEVEFAKGSLKLAMSNFDLETSGPAFPKMIHHVFDSIETERLSVRGEALITVRTALGSLPCKISLGAAHKLSITGMRALRTSPTDYTDLQVVDGNTDHLVVKFNLFLNNPSKNITFALPDSGLNFAAFYRGAFVGRAFVGGSDGPFELTSGPVSLPNVTFKYSPKESEEKAVRQLPAK